MHSSVLKGLHDTDARRRPVLPTWRRAVDCLANKPPPPALPPVRGLARRVVQGFATPGVMTFFVVCMFFGLVVNGYTRIVEEMHHCVHRRSPEWDRKLPVYSEEPAAYNDRFTLMLNSFRRPDLMKRSIRHYSKCASIVHQIRVIWFEDGDPPRSRRGSGVDVVYDVVNGTSLNKRFTPIQGLETEAVMSLDDDIYMPCSDLAKAFKVWKSHKRALVGFFPRLHRLDEDCEYEYYLGTKTYVEGRYSMLLTKAALLHRDYLTLYSDFMPHTIRDYVDSKHNCEDIAMQLLIANFTSDPAEFVNSPWLTDSGKGPFKVQGISSDASHKTYRTECLNDLVKMFDHVPLPFQPLNSNGETLLWIRLSPLVSFFLNLF